MPTDSPIISYNTTGATSPTTIRQGSLYYWPSIQNLTGGTPATDIDAQPIYALPDDALIEVVIPDRGASQWLRVRDSTLTASDPDAGIIVPTTYDSVLKPWALYRQLGF